MRAPLKSGKLPVAYPNGWGSDDDAIAWERRIDEESEWGSPEMASPTYRKDIDLDTVQPTSEPAGSEYYEVYRIEHFDCGVGPFQYYQSNATSVDDRRLLNNMGFEAGDHPELRFPVQDGLSLRNMSQSYVFGCTSIEWLRKWILYGSTREQNEHILERLEDLGFILVEAIVPNESIRHGYSGCQVAYDRDEVVEQDLVHVRSVMELLEKETN